MRPPYWPLFAFLAAVASFASFLVAPSKSSGTRAPAAYDFEKVVISFKDHGKLITQMTKAELVEKLGKAETALFEFHEQKSQTYEAITADRVLDLGFEGGRWRQAEYLVFTCLDGYQNPVPASRFAKFRGMFAVSRKDDPTFMVYNQFQHEKVHLGPIALMWDRLEDKASQVEASSFIPYQVYEINIVDNKDVYGGIDPPAGSSELVKRGMEVYKNHCITCHQMRGKGGKKGPELREISKFFDQNALRARVLDPGKDSTMPSLRAVSSDGEAAADAVVAYLRAMSGRP